MAFTVRGAACLYIVLTALLLAMAVFNTVAVAWTDSWSTESGLFYVSNPSEELILTRALVLAGLGSVFVAFICEVVMLCCTPFPFRWFIFVRCVSIVGGVLGLCGAMASFGQFPKVDGQINKTDGQFPKVEGLRNADVFGIIASANFFLILLNSSFIAIFCDDHCHAQALLTRKFGFNAGDVVKSIRTPLRAMALSVVQRIRRARNSMSWALETSRDSNILHELEAASKDLSASPKEIKARVKEHHDEEHGFPHSYQPMIMEEGPLWARSAHHQAEHVSRSPSTLPTIEEEQSDNAQSSETLATPQQPAPSSVDDTQDEEPDASTPLQAEETAQGEGRLTPDSKPSETSALRVTPTASDKDSNSDSFSPEKPDSETDATRTPLLHQKHASPHTSTPRRGKRRGSRRLDVSDTNPRLSSGSDSSGKSSSTVPTTKM